MTKIQFFGQIQPRHYKDDYSDTNKPNCDYNNWASDRMFLGGVDFTVSAALAGSGEGAFQWEILIRPWAEMHPIVSMENIQNHQKCLVYYFYTSDRKC